MGQGKKEADAQLVMCEFTMQRALGWRRHAVSESLARVRMWRFRMGRARSGRESSTDMIENANT